MAKAGGALAALAVVLVGCSADTGEGGADDPVVTPSSGLPSDYEVPAIAEPLEPGRFADDPCGLLTAEQRAELDLPDTERTELGGTAECLLHPAGDRITTVQLQLMTDRGLADLVAQCRGDNAPAACATWAPNTVDRYPAIVDDGGQCRVMVGIAEQAVLLVNDLKQPECRRATEVATTALSTLREGR
ncbi:hypothetical protein BU204_19980 [Actinophytocola xanthii]|uniref:DUF3558 domain-containing protein n=1 Tax=Actinophytocola xanthii TaxID=1912961 RepID=A0A1Q8CMX0_9PSEU|nr:hypothetical protein BU204_19980 [Actinophytocola xanthii]